jgi:PEP-CTERM motif
MGGQTVRRKLFAAVFVVAAGLASFAAQAAAITYDATDTNGDVISFTYDDTATTIGNGPYACCGSAYDALSFIFDGVSLANPELVIYQNFGGSQFAYFTTSSGYTDYVQLAANGTGLFTSSAANQMDGRSLSDFTYTVFDQAYNGSALYSLTSLTGGVAVTEPATLGLLGLGLLGACLVRRRVPS